MKPSVGLLENLNPQLTKDHYQDFLMNEILASYPMTATPSSGCNKLFIYPVLQLVIWFYVIMKARFW
jgi:hypothetical protein